MACAGLALLFLATRRELRLAGLVAWALGSAALGLYLAPAGREAELAAAGVAGLALAVAGAAVLLRWPWTLAFATLACIPIRLPVDVGDEDANLLLPLYLVVASYAVALGWRLLRGDERSRELGPVAIPLAVVVGWTGLALLWTDDLREGSIFLAAFVLPFGLLSLGFARLPWRRRPLLGLYGALAATALLYAGVGLYQWATREVFWNPKLIVDNAYAPFFRVNSVFWDPSIYGRYLVVAILATLALLLLGLRGELVVAAIVAIGVIWAGLLFSFSQSSFVALIAGTLALATLVWRWRAAAALGLLAVVLVSVGFATPQVRHRLLDESKAGLDAATSGRAGPGLERAPDRGRPSRRRCRHRQLQAGVRRTDRAARPGAEEGGVALDSGDGRGRDRHPRAPAAGLARRGGARGGVPGARPVGCRSPRGRRGPYAWRDRRAQPLLQRALRGSD